MLNKIMKNKRIKLLKGLKEYLSNINMKSLNVARFKDYELLLTKRNRNLIHTDGTKSLKQLTDFKLKNLSENFQKLMTSSSSESFDGIEDNLVKKQPTPADVSSNQRYLDLSKIIVDMKSKIIKVPDTKIPEWKTLNLASSRESVNVKTLRLLSGLVAADKISSRLRRLEDLYHHLLAHPETIAFACKRNAVQILLVMKNSQRDKITLELIGQLLAIFGYVDPPKSRGLRILSIDGGGMRGIAVIKMLEKIENLSGKKVYELFDFICGVSTGAIIACCLVPPHCMPLDKVHQLYRTMSSKVFNQSAFWGTSKLMWNHAYYDTAIWENLLKDYVGNSVLIDTAKYSNCPKIAVISTIVNHSKVAPYIFRNYGNPYNRSSEYHGGFQHSMFEAIRASAAAPTIFEEFRTGNILHQDGGIIVNNPTAVALHEAKLLWPNEHISCIVSCGTGRYDPLPMTDQLRNLKEGSTSWKSMLDKILESATDTESIHTLISDILPEGVYFRLNPHLSGMVSMDDINDERISRLEEDTNMYCRRNEEKFVEISKILVTKRSVFQQTYDKLLYHTKLFKSKIN